MTQQLVLYKFDSCPFCMKVMRYLQERDISIPMKDILIDTAARDELITIGGKSQVPCLVIGDQPLYESDDIINWFETSYAN